MIRVILCGAAGRMGTAISQALLADPELALVLAVERPAHPVIGSVVGDAPVTEDLPAGFRPCDVIVDFTQPQATLKNAQVAVQHRVGFVTGTTGLSSGQVGELREAATCIPLLQASNMSLGVSVVSELLGEVACRLPDYDVEIVEMHHRRKRDAPSGTALRLAEILQEARGELQYTHGRVGEIGERPSRELGIHALRGGDVVGEHRVIFAGPGERLEITHTAENRAAFVTGVLAGVRFIAGRAPGFYAMGDVLGLR